jgi:hypothetical protein
MELLLQSVSLSQCLIRQLANPPVPLFPINSQPPALSPPTPPVNVSPTEGTPFTSGPLSFSHPSAPPPLSTLPARQHADSTSSLLVTPNDVTPASAPAIVQLDEAQAILPPGMSNRTSQSSATTESYFDNAQSVIMEKSRSSGSHASPYSRYPASATSALHPYRRQSPGKPDPNATYQQRVVSSGVDGKPVFAAPFAGGMLAPDGSIGMEKQLSQMSTHSADGEAPAWQTRWHRPSFPFPPPAGANYNYEPEPQADLPQAPIQQAYA